MSAFGKLSKEYGGHFDSHFNQSNYIAQFPKDLRDGCCLALCCNWIGARGNVSKFVSYINTKIGKAQVRGFQGLHVRATQETKNLGGFFTGYVMEVLKIYKVKFNGELAMRDSPSHKEIIGFVSNRPALYQLHISGAGGGHALAFNNSGKGISFFDPNFGQVTFDLKKRLGLFMMFNQVLGNFYSDLNGKWECMRVYG